MVAYTYIQPNKLLREKYMSPVGAFDFASYTEFLVKVLVKAKRVKATDEGESPRNTGIWLLAVFTCTICWFGKYFLRGGVH